MHGAGWRLVTVDPHPNDLDGGQVDWLTTIGGAVVVVPDTTTSLAAWFNAHDVRWALQRPDFHLFGTAADAAGAAALLTDLQGQLA